MEDGILYKILVNKRLGENIKLMVICIPDHYVQEACKIIHVHTGHAALEKSVLSAGSLIYNVDLENQMKEVIKGCVKCFAEKSRVDPQPLELVPVPGEPFEVISMDFIGPLSTGANNNKYILVITDYLTRYIIARPTIDRHTHTVTEILRSEVFTPFEVPKKERAIPR